ncbi:peroxiredoxin [Novosphingobium lentum]|uniref:peroxiredoxin n=1 Tax=Novosphingobium lentum TaxID=145287 RepID=UPI00082E135C|nr:peroxiredoxin [Novosphingobium lentum]
MNRRTLSLALAALALLVPTASQAELAQGAHAPDFAARGALGGKVFSFNLAQALKQGPVVLYFFPKAFTPGCTLEAHAFAEAIDQFKAAGATVVGMSTDDLPALQRFSSLECRDKFPVVGASAQVVAAYDVDLKQSGKSTGLTSRTSYVIGRDGRIVMVHADMDYRDHVRLTLQAVRALHTPHH